MTKGLQARHSERSEESPEWLWHYNVVVLTIDEPRFAIINSAHGNFKTTDRTQKRF